MIDRRVFINALAFALLAAPRAGRTQAAGKFVRIGFLGNSRQAALANGLNNVFIAALRDLGWSEGRNLAIEYRWAEQRYERFPALASELVALGVDLIVVTARVTAALAAKQATATIPILAVGISDPVKFGRVASFCPPGR